MKNVFFIFIITVLFFIACTGDHNKIKKVNKTALQNKKDSTEHSSINDAATILSKKEVPVLYYHHIRNSRLGDYVVTAQSFAEQCRRCQTVVIKQFCLISYKRI